MNKLLLIIPVLLLYGASLYGQAETLLCYDCRTGAITTIQPPSGNPASTFANTGWNVGMDNNKAVLDLNRPQNTMPGSEFTKLVPARTLFDINSFPVRTCANLLKYDNGLAGYSGTGTMIARNLLLTVAHVVIDRSNKIFVDSLKAAPAWDNGVENTLFPTSISARYYILKRFYDSPNNPNADIALVELNEPVGDATGWMGIAYHTNQDYYFDTIFQQFSYPHESPYNGDTLYFAHGAFDAYMDFFGAGYTGMSYAGQSGSSFFYTDNQAWYSLGVLHGVARLSEEEPYITYHCRITSDIFNAFKYIIDNNSLVVPGIKNRPNNFQLLQNYPNPFNPSTTIRYNLEKPDNVSLKIYNLAGQEVAQLVNEYQISGEHRVTWNAAGLPGALYFCRLQCGGSTETRKMILQK